MPLHPSPASYWFTQRLFLYMDIADIIKLVSKCSFTELPYNQAIWLLDAYPEKTIIWRDPYIFMFIASLFTTAKTWKQPKCPLTDEWIQKMWYIYTVEYYSAIKKNEIIPEIIILSEVSQKEKDKYHDITCTWNLNMTQTNLFMKQKRNHRHRKHTVVAKKVRREEMDWEFWDQKIQIIIHRVDKQQGPTQGSIFNIIW